MKGFKQYFKTVLFNEFNARNVYDFYALELAKDKIDDPDLNAKLIERGNDLLDDIINSIGLILFDRLSVFVHYTETPEGLKKDLLDPNYTKNRPEKPEVIQKEREIKLNYLLEKFKKYQDFFKIPRSNYRFYEKIISQSNVMEQWNKLSNEDKKEAIETIAGIYRMFSVDLGRNWEPIYDIFMDNIVHPLFNSRQIIDKINKITQLVHNSGNLLEYMPPSLDRALHFRDNANLNQLIAKSSDEVKSLLKSASIPYKPELPPNHGQMLITAMNRAAPAILNIWKSFEITNIQLIDFEKKQNTEQIESELDSGSYVTLYEQASYEINMTIDPKAIKGEEDKPQSDEQKEKINLNFVLVCDLVNFHKPEKNIAAHIPSNSIQTNKKRLTYRLHTFTKFRSLGFSSHTSDPKEFVQMGGRLISYLAEFSGFVRGMNNFPDMP